MINLVLERGEIMLGRWFHNLKISHKILFVFVALFIAFISFVFAKAFAKTMLLIFVIALIINLLSRAR